MAVSQAMGALPASVCYCNYIAALNPLGSSPLGLIPHIVAPKFPAVSPPAHPLNRLRLKSLASTRQELHFWAVELPAFSDYPATFSIASTTSGESITSLLARSCFMCSALDVPVSGSIPTAPRKGENHLRRSDPALRSQPGDQRMMQHVRICREQREALIHDLPLAAEVAHFAVPAQTGEATILHEGRRLSSGQQSCAQDDAAKHC